MVIAFHILSKCGEDPLIMVVAAGDRGGGGGGLWTEGNRIPLTIATMITSQLHLITEPHHTMVIAKHVSYLIWIVWYPAGPDPIWSPGGGGGPLLSPDPIWSPGGRLSYI